MVGITAGILVVKKATEELFSLFKEGVQINIETEKTKIGIAGLMATVYEMDKNGIKLGGMDKLNASLVLSETVLKRLRISAIETGASFDEVAEGFRNAVGGGARLGIRPEDLEKISTLAANAAKGFGLDKGQTGQEIRALFSGKIDRTATIGTALGFGAGGTFEKEYEAALKKGGDTFKNFLEERLQQFKNAGEVYTKTVGGIFDQLEDTAKLYKGDAAKGLSEELLKLKPIADSLFAKGDFTERLDGVTATLQAIGAIIGQEIVGAFKSVVDTIFEISSYLEQDQSLLNGIFEIGSQIGEIFGTIFGIVGDIFSLFGDVVMSVAQLFGVTSETNQELT